VDVQIVNVTPVNAPDLVWFCVPPAERSNPLFRRGTATKEAWVRERLARGEPVAKLAYWGKEIVGLLQYELLPREAVVRIECVVVDDRHAKKGIATALLESLIVGRQARGIITRVFPGHSPGQLSARSFFLKKGFSVVREAPDLVFLPLEPGFAYQAGTGSLAYVRQPEDLGSAVILQGPGWCPYAHFFNLQAAELVAAIAPDLPVRWIDWTEEPEEFAKRGGASGIVINGTPIRASFFDEAGFDGEVRKALA